MTTKTYKVDIFKVLGNLSKKNNTFFRKLTDEEQKALQPLVLMRWMSGTQDARQVYFLNELVNPLVFSLTNHKELLIDLLSICGSGNFQRFKWTKAPGKRSKKASVVVSVISEYFNYSLKDSFEAAPLLSNEVILDYAEQLGYQPDEIKALKKELKSRG